MFKNLGFAKKYLKNFHALKPEHYEIETAIEEGSAALQQVFSPSAIKANDTSFGVGFAPFSKTEALVLKVANYLNAKTTIKKCPWIGEDIKVMGLRIGKKIKLICSVAFVDKYVKSIEDYFRKKEELERELIKKFKCEIKVNTLDKEKTKANSESDIYLTTTGLSAEMGDDGQTGRGNRVSGLITAERYMSLEAAAGKNPTNHVGKLYNVLANIIASDLVKKKIVRECYIKILSEIGTPIDEPQVILVQIKENADPEKIKQIVNHWFDNIKKVSASLIEGKFSIC